jgi:peptidoglycan-associated lipoprotein
MMIMLMFAGCASKGTKKTDEVGAGQTPPLFDEATQSGGGDGSNISGSNLTGPGGRNGMPGGMPGERVVYFDFDQSEIRPDARAVLEAHANYLTANPAPLRLEGHADERGSREYNLALGERRAEAVRRTLTILGISDAAMTTLTYGEERPIDPGHNEGAWQLNRRVELIYP